MLCRVTGTVSFWWHTDPVYALKHKGALQSVINGSVTHIELKYWVFCVVKVYLFLPGPMSTVIFAEHGKDLICEHLWIKYGLMRFADHSIRFLFAFVIQLCGIGVCKVKIPHKWRDNYCKQKQKQLITSIINT